MVLDLALDEKGLPVLEFIYVSLAAIIGLKNDSDHSFILDGL